MKKLLFIALILLYTLDCNSQESAIKKDLNSRFTGFEIVEIKPDSANVYEAANALNNLKLAIGSANLKISTATAYFDTKTWSFEKTTQYMDSVSEAMADECVKFWKLETSKTEPVYYVEYRIFKDELKILKVEYYYFHKKADGKTDLLHRPCRWDYYMNEVSFSNGMDQCYEQTLKFLKSFSH